jgi:hypothetical protein
MDYCENLQWKFFEVDKRVTMMAAKSQGFGLHSMMTKCTGMESDTIMLGCRIHGMYVTIVQVLFAIMAFCRLPACFWQSSLTIKVTQQRPVASKESFDSLPHHMVEQTEG